MDDDARRWDAAEEGAELLREGRGDDAVAELERVLAEDEDNEYALYFLGNAHFSAERWERALKAYVTALEKQPGYLGAMIGAGHALRMLGRTDQAIRMGKQALLKRKEDPDALYLLGLTHFVRGDKAAALDYLERYLATSPELEVAQEARGLVQVLRGEVVSSNDPTEAE